MSLRRYVFYPSLSECSPLYAYVNGAFVEYQSVLQLPTDGSSLLTARHVDANKSNTVKFTELLNSADVPLNLTAKFHPQTNNDFRDSTYSSSILTSSFTSSSKVINEEPIWTARSMTKQWLVKQTQHSHDVSDGEACDNRAVKDSDDKTGNHSNKKLSRRKNFRPQKRLSCSSVWTSDDDDFVSINKQPSTVQLERILQKRKVQRRQRLAPSRSRRNEGVTTEHLKLNRNASPPSVAPTRTGGGLDQVVKGPSEGKNQARTKTRNKRAAKNDSRGKTGRRNRRKKSSRSRADRTSGGDAVSRAVKGQVEKHRQAELVARPDLLHYPWVSETTVSGGWRAILSPAGSESRSTSVDTSVQTTPYPDYTICVGDPLGTDRTGSLSTDFHGRSQLDLGQSWETSTATSGHHLANREGRQRHRTNQAFSYREIIHHKKVRVGSDREVIYACGPNFTDAVSPSQGCVPDDALQQPRCLPHLQPPCPTPTGPLAPGDHRGRRKGKWRKPLSCPQCHKSLSSRSSLRKHMALHLQVDEPEAPWSCPTCGSRFFTAAGLKSHQVMSHQRGRNYGCLLCPRKFLRPNDLKRHQQVHSDVRQYGCRYCSKMFKYKSNVGLHEMIHTGERPLCCTQCDFRCIQKASINWHMKAYHASPPPTTNSDPSGPTEGSDQAKVQAEVTESSRSDSDDALPCPVGEGSLIYRTGSGPGEGPLSPCNEAPQVGDCPARLVLTGQSDVPYPEGCLL